LRRCTRREPDDYSDERLIDDLLPQPNWPEGHAPKVPLLIDDLERRSEFVSVKLAWASGLMMVVRKAAG
jgi:hypothetical protein